MEKEFKPFGPNVRRLQHQKFTSVEDVRRAIFNIEKLQSSSIMIPQNPFNEKIQKAKHILEIGCGFGRNIPGIMENTSANYYSIDPNEKITSYLWDYVDSKYKSRVYIANSFDEKITSTKFDVVFDTYTLHHLNKIPNADTMDLDDITQKVLESCHKDTIWVMIETENEKPNWISEWAKKHNFTLSVFIRDYLDYPEVNETVKNINFVAFKVNNAGIA